MALINCPECSKEVSSKTISCPNCGFDVKHRHWYSKKWGRFIIIITILFLFLSGYKFYNKTKGLVNTIDIESKNEFIKDTKLEKINEKYNELSFIEKLFVYNYYKIKKILIEVSGNNLKKFLNICVNFSNYNSSYEKVILGIKKYTETANINVSIKSNGKYKFENVEFRISLNNGYKIKDQDITEDLKVKLDSNGNFNYNGLIINNGILNNSITSDLKEPTFNIEKVNLLNVSGYIYYK